MTDLSRTGDDLDPVLSFKIRVPGEKVVSSWTEFGKLEEVIVGRAQQDQCYPPNGPDFHHVPNNQALGAPWPYGPKTKESIRKANVQYDLLAELLEGEGIIVHRPTETQQNSSTKTPNWKCVTQYNCCPRDKLLIVGNELIEASMSNRSRIFEEYCYRDLIMEYYKRDPRMIWTAAPKPMMKNELYRDYVDRQQGRTAHWDLGDEQLYEKGHNYEFSTTEAEPVWDAADCTRLGKDIFMLHSNTTNRFGFEWLRRHLQPKGVDVHFVHSPYNYAAAHIDCTLVPVRPGLVLTCPDRPIPEEDVSMFREGNWKFIDVPKPEEWWPRADYCYLSNWLMMNVLSIGPNKIIIEEEEKDLYNMLDDLGFDVLTVPFRDCYEFGGSIHCATSDIRRDDHCEDFFKKTYN